MDSNVDSLLDQNHLLTAEIQRRVNQLAAINAVAATVSQSLDLERSLQTALDAVLGIIVVDSAAISLVDEEHDELVLRAQRGLDHDFVTRPFRLQLGQGLSGRAVIEDRLLVSEDLEQEEALAVPAFLAEHVRAIALAPMHARGQVVGMLSVMSHKPYHFSEEELHVLRVIADQVGVALDNARLYEKTRHQQRRLSAIIHSTADAIIATDNWGRISLINNAARRLFHLSNEDVLGLPLGEAPLHPQVVDGLKVAMQSRAEEATLFDVRLNDGRTLSAVVSRVHAGPTTPGAVFYDDGDEGWVLVLQDVSEYKQAEDARVEFVRAAAHDMRNPLGVTLSAITLLQDHVTSQDDPVMTETLDIAINSLHRMEVLIDDMLQLERMESGLNFKPQAVEVTELVTRIFHDFTPVLQRRDQQGELVIMTGPLTLDLDLGWFSRALNNYLSNASKYTHEGGRIVLQMTRGDGELHIEVRDNGPGIPVEAQPRLFEKFYRAPSLVGRKAPEGTGLGLAIVKSVVEAHGGRVYARSTPGQGSTFGMALPLPEAALTTPA